MHFKLQLPSNYREIQIKKNQRTDARVTCGMLIATIGKEMVTKGSKTKTERKKKSNTCDELPRR